MSSEKNRHISLPYDLAEDIYGELVVLKRLREQEFGSYLKYSKDDYELKAIQKRCFIDSISNTKRIYGELLRYKNEND